MLLRLRRLDVQHFHTLLIIAVLIVLDSCRQWPQCSGPRQSFCLIALCVASRVGVRPPLPLVVLDSCRQRPQCCLHGQLCRSACQKGCASCSPYRNCMPFACHCCVQELCQHPQVKAHILDQLTAVGKAGKLRGFELVKAIHTGQPGCLATLGLLHQSTNIAGRIAFGHCIDWRAWLSSTLAADPPANLHAY